MVIILFLIGLFMDCFVHLIIPFCFSRCGKKYSNKTLWLIAIAGGLVGFVVVQLMDVGFMPIVAIFNSGVLTFVGYAILKDKCLEKKEAAKEKTEQEQNKD